MDRERKVLFLFKSGNQFELLELEGNTWAILPVNFTFWGVKLYFTLKLFCSCAKVCVCFRSLPSLSLCTRTHALCQVPCSILSPALFFTSFIPPSLNWASRQVLATETLAQIGEGEEGRGMGCQQLQWKGEKDNRRAREEEKYLHLLLQDCFVDYEDTVSRKIREYVFCQ